MCQMTVRSIGGFCLRHCKYLLNYWTEAMTIYEINHAFLLRSDANRKTVQVHPFGHERSWTPNVFKPTTAMCPIGQSIHALVLGTEPRGVHDLVNTAR